MGFLFALDMPIPTTIVLKLMFEGPFLTVTKATSLIKNQYLTRSLKAPTTGSSHRCRKGAIVQDFRTQTKCNGHICIILDENAADGNSI